MNFKNLLLVIFVSLIVLSAILEIGFDSSLSCLTEDGADVEKTIKPELSFAAVETDRIIWISIREDTYSSSKISNYSIYSVKNQDSFDEKLRTDDSEIKSPDEIDNPGLGSNYIPIPSLEEGKAFACRDYGLEINFEQDESIRLVLEGGLKLKDE